jgi:hypothetical protein
LYWHERIKLSPQRAQKGSDWIRPDAFGTFASQKFNRRIASKHKENKIYKWVEKNTEEKKG